MRTKETYICYTTLANIEHGTTNQKKQVTVVKQNHTLSFDYIQTAQNKLLDFKNTKEIRDW